MTKLLILLILLLYQSSKPSGLPKLIRGNAYSSPTTVMVFCLPHSGAKSYSSYAASSSSSSIVTPRKSAIFFSIPTVGLLFPCIIRDIYAPETPAASASFFCFMPLSSISFFILLNTLPSSLHIFPIYAIITIESEVIVWIIRNIRTYMQELNAQKWEYWSAQTLHISTIVRKMYTS